MKKRPESDGSLSASPCLGPLVAALLLVAPTIAAQETNRPKKSFLRQNEDWEAFGTSGEAASSDDPFDAWKYIPLDANGDNWISFGGWARGRYEYWTNFNFGLAPGVNNDDGFLLSSLFLHADLHLGASNRVFVEGKTAQSTERDLPGGTRTLDVDSLDLQQAFWDYSTDLSGGRMTLRLGRQMLLLGKQRLVSPLPWGNTLRTWDGVSLFWKNPVWGIQTFWTRYAPVDIGDFNRSKDGPELYGSYAERRTEGQPDLDLYVLGYDSDSGTFNGSSGEETRYTFGFRIEDRPAGAQFDYEAEAAYQIGEVGSADVGAYMFGGVVGYSLQDAPLSPRLRLGLDIGSGDEGAGGDVGTFNQLFPLGHAYLGFLDTVGRQNILDLHVGADLQLGPGWKGRIDVHSFRLMSDEDALYNAGGGVVIPGGTSDSEDVGMEIDLTTAYRLDRHWLLTGGVGRFFAGETVDDAAAATGSGGDDIDFLYVAADFTF